MLNCSAPPRNAPVVSRSEGAVPVGWLVVVLRGSWSRPRGRVAYDGHHVFDRGIGHRPSAVVVGGQALACLFQDWFVAVFAH